MLEFKVTDMTCGHCVATITDAVHALSPSLSVETDLAQHRVRIGGVVDSATVQQTIRDAGYTPVLLS